MSSDNGIYIHNFRNGWRVVHGQCIENVLESKKAMREYFSDSPLFKTANKAMIFAWKLYKKTIKEYGIIEYGIQLI